MTLGAGVSGVAGADRTAGTAPPFTTSGDAAGLAEEADLLTGDSEFVSGVRASAGVPTSLAGSLFPDVAVGSASMVAGSAAGCELGTGMDAAGFGGAGWALFNVAVEGVEMVGN